MLAWNNKRFAIAFFFAATIGSLLARAASAGDKPNILVIMGETSATGTSAPTTAA
jgi:hypothetical protein